MGLTLGLGAVTLHAAELGDTVWIPMVDPDKGAEETFALNTLGMIRGGEGGDADWRIFRGKYRASVSRHDFFITVGRPDLARRQSSRQSRHTLMVVGGIVSAVAGVYVAYAAVSKGGWDPPLAPGAGLIAAGLLAYWTSGVFSGPDLEIGEAESLIRRYNERLQDRLIRPGTREKQVQVVQSFQLAPWIAAGSGGLAVAGRF
jgi:hypothetical protein